MFEVEYLWNGWVKKNGVNANLVYYHSPNFNYPIDFAFSPRLNRDRQSILVSTSSAITEVALQTNSFEICCRLLALYFQKKFFFLLITQVIL